MLSIVARPYTITAYPRFGILGLRWNKFQCTLGILKLLPGYFQTVHSLVLNVHQAWNKKMKWNESGFRSSLCTYRLNWARRTSCGWWDDWDGTVLQTQDSKFEPRARYLSVTEAPHNTNFHTWMRKKHILFLSNRRDREPNPELWRERQRC